MSTRFKTRRRASRALYRRLNGLYRALFPSDAPAERLPASYVRRVLVVRHDAAGDMAVTLPALAYLAAALPHAEIDVVASPRNAALLEGDPRVHQVEVNDHSWRSWLRLVRSLRARRYDCVVSALTSRGLREGLFAALVAGRHGARVSLWRQPQYVGLFTHLHRPMRSQRHMATRLLTLVQSAVGDGPAPAPCDADPARWPAALAHDPAADARAERFVAAHVPGEFVALNAWAAEPARALGHRLTTELACRLATCHDDLTVVLTPPPRGADDAHAVAAEASARLGRDDRVIVAPPGATLRDLVAVLRRAAFVVTPDTANVHLASAVGTPVVSIHTPLAADPRDWGPWGVPHRTVMLPTAVPLSETEPEAVMRAVQSLLLAMHGAVETAPSVPRGR